MSRGLNIEASEAAARQDFAKAASLWRLVMSLSLGWAGLSGLIALLVAFRAATAGPGSGDDALDFAMRIYYSLFWLGQVAGGLLLWLAAWTFRLFAKDKADSM